MNRLKLLSMMASVGAFAVVAVAAPQRPKAVVKLQPVCLQYDYELFTGVPVGMLSDTGTGSDLPVARTKGDTEVVAAVLKGTISVTCSGDEIYLERTVSHADGYTVDRRTKDMSHRYASRERTWLTKDEVFKTSEGPMVGPEDFKLVLSRKEGWSDPVGSWAIPANIATATGVESFLPEPRVPDTTERVVGDCDRIIRNDLESDTTVTRYESRVPLSDIAEGDELPGAVSLSIVSEEAESGLPIEVESYIEGADRSRMMMGYSRFKWANAAQGSRIPAELVSASGMASQSAFQGKPDPLAVAHGGAYLRLTLKEQKEPTRQAALTIPPIPDTRVVMDAESGSSYETSSVP